MALTDSPEVAGSHHPGRIRRLAEELAADGFTFPGADDVVELVLEELDYALHPAVHERRVPTYGSFVAPTVGTDDWEEPTQLEVPLTVRARVIVTDPESTRVLLAMNHLTFKVTVRSTVYRDRLTLEWVTG